MHDEHRHIVATLRDGDAEGAARTVEGHIRRTRRMLAATPSSSHRPDDPAPGHPIALHSHPKEGTRIMARLGFLGLGHMGSAMAGPLVAAADTT